MICSRKQREWPRCFSPTNPPPSPQQQSLLRTADTSAVDTTNACGDAQIAADVAADAACFDALRSCGVVAIAASEETAVETDLGGASFSIAFDPLDGSSVAGAGWAIGAIFGVWPGRGLVGRTGEAQCASVYAVLGPRVVLVLAAPVAGATAPLRVDEFVLVPRAACEGSPAPHATWARTAAHVRLAPLPDGHLPATFAPANLRAASTNPAYRTLVTRLIDAGSTLRYSGAMVADVHHILAKRKGVFYNPVSPSAPPKLRLLFEVAPIALIMEAVGGVAVGAGGKRVLELEIAAVDTRAAVAFGQAAAVALAADAF